MQGSGITQTHSVPPV